MVDSPQPMPLEKTMNFSDDIVETERSPKTPLESSKAKEVRSKAEPEKSLWIWIGFGVILLAAIIFYLIKRRPS